MELLSLFNISDAVSVIRAILERDVKSQKPPAFILKLAVVGNRKFKNLPLVEEFLNKLSKVFQLVVISGEAEGVDSKAKQWAESHNCQYIGFLPKTHKRWDEENEEWIFFIPNDEYYARNKQIAEECQVLLAFINKGRYHAGTWNTINWLTKKATYNYFFIYNEYGEIWKHEEYPKWLRRRV